METGMITSTTTAATASASTAKTPSSALDKDSFLKLLVAQLKNQDPTGAGQDPNQMIQQLTSFSSLEQAQQTNTLLGGLQTQTAGLFQAQAASLVGKTVTVDGSGFNLRSGAATMNINLSTSANTTLTVKDATGKVVAILPEGYLKAGPNTLSWNGRDANGLALPDGPYSVTVAATDDRGKATPYTTSLSVKVDSVVFKNGGVYLMAGTNAFALTDVLNINA